MLTEQGSDIAIGAGIGVGIAIGAIAGFIMGMPRDSGDTSSSE